MRRLSTDEKVIEIDALAQAVAEHRAAGRRVVQCHGVFDLLHPGHLAHLEAAKEQADVLVVTLTADRFINKGPGRPVFTESLRARALAALSCVDHVAVNAWPTAVEAIGAIRPDLYAKGSEYQRPEDDLTGKIVDEREAIEAVGGSLIFTDEVTFSSSSLINSCFSVYSPETEAWLRGYRGRADTAAILEEIEKMHDRDVLVVGEAILDEYVFCQGLGKSSKDPILAFKYERKDRYAGGSLAVANHMAEFCRSVRLVTLLDQVQERNTFIRGVLHPNVRLDAVHQDAIPTIRKRRFVDLHTSSKVFEYYFMDDRPPAPETEGRLLEAIRAEPADVTVVTDYGHGLFTPGIIEALGRIDSYLCVNTQSNAGNRGFNTISKYPRADYVCLNGTEISLETRRRYEPWKDQILEVIKKIHCPRFTVTQGSKGLLHFSNSTGFVEVPAFNSRVKDRVGAGDAVLAITSLLVSQNAPWETVGFVGNLAGSQMVDVMGNEKHLDKVLLQKQIVSLLK